MALIIRSVFVIFWAAASGFSVFLAYSILQTEQNPQLIYAWLLFCGFTFLSATWLTYNALFAHFHKPGPRHHDRHLK